MRHEDRKLGRQMAFQFLFGLEFSGYEPETALAQFWEMEPAALTAESFDDGEDPAFAPPSMGGGEMKRARKYAERLVSGVLSNEERISGLMDGAVENWSADRVGRVESIVLRVALYEMLEVGEVPQPVSINEAVNMTKAFGSEEGARFVNAVLDKIRVKNSPPAAEKE